MVLKTLSKKELLKLRDFLESPYFNKGKKYIVRFFAELIRYYPDFTVTGTLNLKKDIYRKIYPREKYSDVRFRKLTSGLYKLLLEFLSVENYLSDPAEINLKVLKELNRRNPGNIFESELKNSYTSLRKTDLRNDNYLKNMYEMINTEKFFYFPRKRNKALEKFDDEMNYFNRYALTLYLSKYIERAMEIRFFRAQKFDYPLFSEIVSFIKKNQYLNEPVIELLYLQLKLCIEDDDESFYRLRKLLTKQEKKIGKDQVRIIYNILSNYSAERSEKGIEGFHEQLLDIYLEVVKKDLYDQYISGFLFMNIVTLFLRFSKMRELKKFISENSEKLNPEIKEAIMNYCHARLSFSGGDTEKALVYLSKINFDHYQLKFQIKNLTLKIYYEQEHFESVFSLIDSYKHILKRESDIPESIKKTIMNFLKILKQLSDIRSGKKRTDRQLLLKETENSTPAEKIWLIEKINEI